MGIRQAAEIKQQRYLNRLHADFNTRKDDLNGRAPIAAADLHKASEIRDAFANSVQTHARRSTLVAAFLCRCGDTLALIFHLQPDLLIGKRSISGSTNA